MSNIFLLKIVKRVRHHFIICLHSGPVGHHKFMQRDSNIFCLLLQQFHTNTVLGNPLIFFAYGCQQTGYLIFSLLQYFMEAQSGVLAPTPVEYGFHKSTKNEFVRKIRKNLYYCKKNSL